jgi:hypothetical protein
MNVISNQFKSSILPLNKVRVLLAQKQNNGYSIPGLKKHESNYQTIKIKGCFQFESNLF